MATKWEKPVTCSEYLDGRVYTLGVVGEEEEKRKKRGSADLAVCPQ